MLASGLSDSNICSALEPRDANVGIRPLVPIDDLIAGDIDERQF